MAAERDQAIAESERTRDVSQHRATVSLISDAAPNPNSSFNPHSDSSPESQQKNDRFPPHIWLIFSSECAERYSYYGMRAVLLLYLTDYLRFNKESAMSIYHTFIAVAYLASLPGGVISDARWGKYNTIVRLSLVYCVGSAVLAITAIPGFTGDPPHWWGAMVGLMLIAIGTGGIKPCVSAMGADQFVAGQEHLVERFFMVFYTSINVGSTLSTFITPVMRESSGYAAAFALPAVLLVVALGVFIAGKKKYRRVPPGGSIMLDVIKLVVHALREKYAAWRLRRNQASSGTTSSNRNSRHGHEQHWLEYAHGAYSETMVSSVKILFSVSIVLSPCILFWALFDLHSSLFILQAQMMDRRLGSVTVTPDQMPLLNPVFVLVLVPIFDRLVYPACRKMGFPLKPLSRMAVGMFFAVAAFVAGGLVQMRIEAEGDGKVPVLWQVPQFLLLTIGEVLVSISGLEFAYAQAPTVFKSVLSAVWLLWVAAANIFVVLVEVAFADVFAENHEAEFFFYAACMVVVGGIFVWMTMRYRDAKDIQPGKSAARLPQSDDEVDKDRLVTEGGFDE